jgi:hypothetical protein
MNEFKKLNELCILNYLHVEYMVCSLSVHIFHNFSGAW